MANKAIAPHSLIRIFVALFLLPFICRSSHILSQDTSGYGLDSSFGHGVDILETEPMIDRPSNDNDSIPGTSLHPQHQSHVFRRDFTCGPGQPCSNSACCGASGFCGYGPTYCSTGCQSNCDAVAECGQFASPAGKTCPLNTCCSQFGFCGTTADFCGNNCQSNCVLHPTPPGGPRKSEIRDRVIGYYESWAARLACHQRMPGDLPLSSLTHLNYAFGYIDPSSFELVTMDPETDKSLFDDVAAAKAHNSGLKVFLSVGGWTFSDNFTATQPVFGNIASSAANRQTFATNVVKFMKTYGYDGIDIDWEYPGAGDRGGNAADTANFVLLMKDLRAAFDASGKDLGITFTAPSSFWYLRWFDLPGLLKYADWVNVMSYDLHGEWDKLNPIGSIVQAHTNLTELDTAMELFWRAGVPPSKIVMGFGFYGRSFQLANPSCNTPGCAFQGSSLPGPCSNQAGILMYYEIMALLQQNPGLTPVWDQTAAVKYLTYGGNQWISYDDADTFKQKVDWANNLGLAGALIWASDTDDDEYSAHSGLLGNYLGKTPLHPSLSMKQLVFNPDKIANSLVGVNGQACKIQDPCVSNPEDTKKNHCPSGWVNLGWEKGKCGSKKGHLICCPASQAPESCLWRGGTGNAAILFCNGQCHEGETEIFRSSWGGAPSEPGSDQTKCGPGYKSFCCAAGALNQITKGCRWTGCDGRCDSLKEEEVSTKRDDDVCKNKKLMAYCCPRPSSLYDCHWKGNGNDCTQANCAPDEVEIDLNHQGDVNKGKCAWGRNRVNCCKVRTPKAEALTCANDPCFYAPEICEPQPWNTNEADVFSNPFKRDLSESSYMSDLVKRADKDLKKVIALGTLTLEFYYRRWLRGRTELLKTPANRVIVPSVILELRGGANKKSCTDSKPQERTLDTTNFPTRLPKNMQTDHSFDKDGVVTAVEQLRQGRLLSGRPLFGGPRTDDWLSNVLFKKGYFANQNIPPVAAKSPKDDANSMPFDRFLEGVGSGTNPAPFLAWDGSLNGMKGTIMSGRNIIGVGAWRDGLNAVRNNNEVGMRALLAPFQVAIGIFRTMQMPRFQTTFQRTLQSLHDQAGLIENHTLGSEGFQRQWDDIVEDLYATRASRTQDFMRQRIRLIREAIGDLDTAEILALKVSLDELENDCIIVTYPFRVRTWIEAIAWSLEGVMNSEYTFCLEELCLSKRNSP